MNTLILASGLSDHELLARIGVLAGSEREATVELVAHLAALDTRPALYAAQGFRSLFSYCTQVLRLSEDATCNRIEAARACRDFPVILEALASGAMSLTSVRLLRRHLTPENHEAVPARASRPCSREPVVGASGKSRRWWRSWRHAPMSPAVYASCRLRLLRLRPPRHLARRQSASGQRPRHLPSRRPRSSVRRPFFRRAVPISPIFCVKVFINYFLVFFFKHKWPVVTKNSIRLGGL